MPGWDKHRRADYSHGDPAEMPADLAALQADDALLDLIGGGAHISSDTDDELTRVLSEWRREVHAEPVREIVDTTTAMAVIRAAVRRPAGRRHPVMGSAAAAAAVLVIAFSAVGLVAKAAQPGDHLWGVTQVLYSDYARSVETAAAVRTELDDAKVALKQGNPERARAALQHIKQQLPVVGEDQGKTELIARHRQLEHQLAGPVNSDPAKLSEGPTSGPPRPTRTGPDTTRSTTPTGPSPSEGSFTPMPNPGGYQPGNSTKGFDGYPGYYPPLDRYPRPGTGPSGSGSQDSSTAGEKGSPDTRTGPADGTTSRGSAGPGSAGTDGSTGNTGPGRTASPSPAPSSGYQGPATGSQDAGHPNFYSVCDRPGPRPQFCGTEPAPR